MAYRKRMIDPNFWSSEDTAKLSVFERLMFIGMFQFADDYGKGRANPYLLRSLIFPYDSFSIEEIEKAIKNIEKNVSIQLYEIDGSKYYLCTSWKKWQRVDKPTNSIFPDPDLSTKEDDSKIPPGDIQEPSGNDMGEVPPSIVENSIVEGNIEENSINDEATTFIEDEISKQRTLIELYRELNGKTHSSTADINTEKDLRDRYDFDETLALTAIRKCHLSKTSNEPGWRASALSYYVPAIVAALEHKNGRAKVNAIPKYDDMNI